MTRYTSKKWVNHLPETVIDRNEIEHPVWSVPAPCCAMQYANDERYLPGRFASKNKGLVAGRQYSVEFYEMRSPDSPSDY